MKFYIDKSDDMLELSYWNKIIFNKFNAIHYDEIEESVRFFLMANLVILKTQHI